MARQHYEQCYAFFVTLTLKSVRRFSHSADYWLETLPGKLVDWITGEIIVADNNQIYSTGEIHVDASDNPNNLITMAIQAVEIEFGRLIRKVTPNVESMGLPELEEYGRQILKLCEVRNHLLVANKLIKEINDETR